jgi:hypothetical protein
MNSSGTTLCSFDFGVEHGGEGFVEYSVRDKELILGPGVTGRLSTPLTLGLTPFSISPSCS